MAPSSQPSQQVYSKDERVLCFHHELLYEAKVLDSKPSDPNDKKSQVLYRVHYKGWKNTWDDWVSGDRVRKYTEENKELAQNLKKDLDAQRKPALLKTTSKKKAGSSDRSSNRASEERHSSVPATSRGQKRTRDEVDKNNRPYEPKSLLAPTGSLLHIFDIVCRIGRGQDCYKLIKELSPLDADMFTKGMHRHVHVHCTGNMKSKHFAVEARMWCLNRMMSVRSAFDIERLNLGPASYGDIIRTNWLTEMSAQDRKKMIQIRPALASTFISKMANTQEAPGPVLHDFSLSSNISEESSANSDNANQDESSTVRPLVRIPIPFVLKGILVDDWEHVTKNLSLVPLPSQTPVTLILDQYYDDVKGKAPPGSADADLLLEFVDGLRAYFAEALGRILLYRFEREQYAEVRKLWVGAAVGSKWDGMGAMDVYGAEHLARLFVSMPKLIEEAPMDAEAVHRLREEFIKLIQWVCRRVPQFFNVPYQPATADYIERAKKN